MVRRRVIGKAWSARAALATGIAGLLVLSCPAFGQPRGMSASGKSYPAQLAEQEKAHPTLTVGSPAPDFSLPGTDGKTHTLAEFKNSRWLAVVFLSDHCPASQLYEERVKRLVADYGPKGVSFVAIQPNSPNAIWSSQLNFTDVGDTLADMKVRAQYRQFTFPYLYDGETQSVAHKYGPKVTPHIFIFDEERKLRYEGRIDDNQRETSVKTQDARNALEALVSGRPVPADHTPVFGCAVKWATWEEQIDSKQRENKEWQALPVKLEAATAEDLEKLRANPTGKVLMVTFWSTRSGPSVARLPDVLQTYLWYRSRNFDLVTVSTDAPEAKPAVLRLLEDRHSPVRNLQFASADARALQAAFDPEWNSGAPFTIVLAPDGKVIYRSQGDLDVLAVRRAILANLDEGSYPGIAAYWARK